LDKKSIDLARDTHSSLKKAPSVTQPKDKMKEKDDFFRALKNELDEYKSLRNLRLI